MHFYSTAARLMRRVLMDHAPARATAKRGGQVEKISLDEAGDLLRDDGAGLVALDDALQGLTQRYPRQGQVVELRFFGGMNTREIGEVLQVSESTVERDWQFALLWLKREMTADEDTDAANPARS